MNDFLNNTISYFYKDNRILSLLLGGSRSKGTARPDSDYDLFVLIESELFQEFRDDFPRYLEEIEYIQYAAEYSYIENWGYIFKIIGEQDHKQFLYDMSILPYDRLSEMGIRNTNNILFDKTGMLMDYKSKNKRSYDTKILELKRKDDYVRLFGFEYLRFIKSYSENDYWLAFKAIDRMKTYLMRYSRIKSELFSGTQHCPEKNTPWTLSMMTYRAFLLLMVLCVV